MVDLIDGKAPCPDCGNYYAVLKNGSIRNHACIGKVGADGVITVAAKKPTRAQTAAAKNAAPTTVRSLGSALIAGGVEWGSVQYMRRAIPCTPEQIPDGIKDVPDADKMVGPFINILWPAIPKGAQNVISKIAEHEDIIAALMLWSDYFGHINGFTKTNHKLVMDQQRSIRAQAQPNVNAGVNSNVATETPTPNGRSRGAELPTGEWQPEPFQPAS